MTAGHLCLWFLAEHPSFDTTGYNDLCSSLGTHWPLLSQSIYPTQLAGKDFYLNVVLFRKDVMYDTQKMAKTQSRIVVTGGYLSRVNPAKQTNIWLKSGN